MRAALNDTGFAVLPKLLTRQQCDETRALYAQTDLFRSRVIMARHNYGRGEYQYFGYPLPQRVAELREALYPKLAPLANAWGERLRQKRCYPKTLADFTAQCHRTGQKRPTPLLLRYGEGDYNCLHQDLYGELAFPLQVIVLLSAPGADFAGGELIVVEQRPRMQSRPHVIALGQGDAAIVAVHHRPARGKRGDHRVNLRHGVSTVTRGERYTLGLIFHDAR